MTCIHPQRRIDGREVIINTPSTATAPSKWAAQSEQATVTPQAELPSNLNNLPFSCGATQLPLWEQRAEHAEFDEPPFESHGLTPAAGTVLLEPDGRIWIVHPTNQFAGYSATFPKGTQDAGRSLRATAVRECFEESALLAELTSWLGDVDRSASRTRYYLARRVGGTPADMGWESQAVSLVPARLLGDLLTSPHDQPLLQLLRQQLITN